MSALRIENVFIKLIKTDDEWDHCLWEAVNFYFPKTLYQVFSFILIFHNPTNTRELYDKYKLYFINPKIHEIISERNALKLINNTLSLHGYSIQDVGLPDIFNKLMEYNNDIEDIYVLVKSGVSEITNSVCNNCVY